MADSDPVTTRFGPRSSPMSSARGCRGEFDDKSTAAGRLLTRQEEAVAIQAEATVPTEPIRRPGAPHTRVSTPSATATVNSPAKRSGLAARAASWQGKPPGGLLHHHHGNPQPEHEESRIGDHQDHHGGPDDADHACSPLG